MSLGQTALVGFLLTTVSRAFHLYTTLSGITDDYLRIDNSHTSIKKIKKSASHLEKITGLCFWNTKSSIQHKVRISICVRIFAVAMWFVFMPIVIGCFIGELFRPSLIFMLKFTLIFDFGLMFCEYIYIVFVTSKLHQQKRKR